MEALSGFTKGKIKQPILAIVYGPDGIGKTTLAADAPSPIIIGPERGSANMDVARFGTSTWQEVLDRSNDLLTKAHDFKTVAYDSLDFIEGMMWKHLCQEHKQSSIEECFGGYGKWVNGTVTEFAKLMDLITQIREKRKMNVILIAHSQVKTVNDPLHPPYDKHQLKLQDKSAAKWREFVDAVLFANFEDTVFKEKTRDRKGKAVGEGTRMLYATRTAAFDAKNRLGLPPSLPLSWTALHTAIEAGEPDTIEEVKKDLEDLLSRAQGDVKDKMVAAITKAGSDVIQLVKIRNHGRVVVGEGV